MPKQNIQISEIYPNAINCTDVRFDWPIIELLGTKFGNTITCNWLKWFHSTFQNDTLR